MMRSAWWFVSLLMTPVLAGLPEGTVTRGESGVKIGTGERGTTTPRGTRGSSAVKIGEGGFPNSTRKRVLMTTSTTTAPTTTITTTMLPSRFTYTPQSSVGNNHNSTYLKVGMMVPYKTFGVRDYTKAVTSAINMLQKSTRGPRLGLFQNHDIHVKISMMELTPSPTKEDDKILMTVWMAPSRTLGAGRNESTAEQIEHRG
uniref:Uncharacterized protein n=1 Tax=Vespula pensylvanica TaxID=30213 RepID=A0A834UAR4_VESPE|nr:hypothetical protein H0235_006581 [Vespula pensylvanica]